MVTQSDIVQGLQALGLRAGCRVLVHSALSSFGHVEGGADTVIDALLDTVGEQGTILVPTLTGSASLSVDNPPVFNPAATPCWTGRIPETFRQHPAAIRSLHPTHSVAAIGADAERLTASHIDSITPCDDGSPYGLLPTLPDSYILLLGVTHESNTTFHHIEEAVGVSYQIQPEMVRAEIHHAGQVITRHTMLHRYGPNRRFMVMEPALLERGIQVNGMIGQAVVRMIDARRMVPLCIQALRANPLLLCDVGNSKE